MLHSRTSGSDLRPRRDHFGATGTPLLLAHWFARRYRSVLQVRFVSTKGIQPSGRATSSFEKIQIAASMQIVTNRSCVLALSIQKWHYSIWVQARLCSGVSFKLLWADCICWSARYLSSNIGIFWRVLAARSRNRSACPLFKKILASIRHFLRRPICRGTVPLYIEVTSG